MKCTTATRTRMHHMNRTRIAKASSAPADDSLVILLGIDPAIAALVNRPVEPVEVPSESASTTQKTVYRPICWQTAKAHANTADREDVLVYAGSAAAARLFRAADRVAVRKASPKQGWKAKKSARQWTGCPAKVTTKRDKRLEMQRQARREKQLNIPPWDKRMMTTFCK